MVSGLVHYMDMLMLAFASFMLFAWVLITAMIFARLSPAKAVVISLLWGYLLLPEKVGLNLPILPTLDKSSVSVLATLLFYMLALKREEVRERLFKRRHRGNTEAVTGATLLENRGNPRPQLFMMIAVLVLILSCVLNYVNNRNADVFGVVYLRGMSFYDCLSHVQTSLLMILPLFVVRHALARKDMGLFLLKSIAIAGLVYSLPVLFEVRMSPQLNRWTYGFFAHDWIQHIRGGHFRPIVFLGHGLLVGIFLALATAAIATLCRVDPNDRTRRCWWLALPYMIIVLYLSRNTGAFALIVLAVPAIIILPVRLQIWSAAALSAIVLVYPMARGTGFIPVESIVAQFEKVDMDRAQSLAFRLKHEDILLERANHKPLTGWGTFGRNRVYDPETGRDLSVTDGIWLIILGIRGWIGYLSIFALLCLPPILLALRRRDVTRIEAGLSVMLVINLIDLIPNASMVTHVWIIAAALWAQLPRAAQSPSTQTQSGKFRSAKTRYTPRAHRTI